MTPAELATILFVFCGKGFEEKAIDCRDKVLNCSVGPSGEIEKNKVEECIQKQKGK